MTKQSKYAILFLGLIWISACVLPQGDEYEKVYYGDVYTKFRLAVANVDGSDFIEASMLPLNYFYDRMSITYFTNQDQNLLIANNKKAYLLNAQNLILLKSVSLNFSKIYESDVSPDGQNIVFGAQTKEGNRDLFLMNTHDLTMTNLTQSPETLERYPSFTQDGQNIVFTSIEFERQQAIVKLNLQNMQFDTLLSTQATASTPQDYHVIFISPFLASSDSILYYCSFVSKALVSYSLKANLKNIFYQGVYPWLPLCFSRNGHYALLLSNQYPHQLIRIDLHNKSADHIGQLDNYDRDYALSPDGSKIAYLLVSQKNEIDGIRSNYYDYFELWLTQGDGSKKTFLATGRWPVFSSDGRKIAFYKAYYQADH